MKQKMKRSHSISYLLHKVYVYCVWIFVFLHIFVGLVKRYKDFTFFSFFLLGVLDIIMLCNDL